MGHRHKPSRNLLDSIHESANKKMRVPDRCPHLSPVRQGVNYRLVSPTRSQLTELCNDWVQGGAAGLRPDGNLTGFGPLDFL